MCWRRCSRNAVRTVGRRKSRLDHRFSLGALQSELPPPWHVWCLNRSAPHNALISSHIFSSGGKVGLEALTPGAVMVLPSKTTWALSFEFFYRNGCLILCEQRGKGSFSPAAHPYGPANGAIEHCGRSTSRCELPGGHDVAGQRLPTRRADQVGTQNFDMGQRHDRRCAGATAPVFS